MVMNSNFTVRNVWVKQYQNKNIEICRSPRLLTYSKMLLLVSTLLIICSESVNLRFFC